MLVDFYNLVHNLIDISRQYFYIIEVGMYFIVKVKFGF